MHKKPAFLKSALVLFLYRLISSIVIFLGVVAHCYSENISDSGILLLDSDKNLSAETVLYRLKNRTGAELNGSVGFPKHAGNYWYATSFTQSEFDTRKAIRLANAHFRVINLYLYSDGQLVQQLDSGYRLETEGLHNLSVDWVAELTTPEAGRYDVILNISSPIVSSLNVNYEDYDEALIISAYRTIFLFFMIGITVSLAVHNLLLGFSIRDYGHILYAFHSLFGSLFLISAYGLFKVIFGFYDDELHFYKPASVGIQLFGTWFCYVFLKIPERFPKLVWLFKGLMIFYASLFLLYPFVSREFFSIASAAPHPFFGGLMVGSAWAAYRDGLKPALYLFIGWVALIIGSTLPALATIGLVPSFENILLVALCGHVFEMYMLSLAISQKFRTIQLNSIATEEVNRSRSLFLSYFSHEVKTPIVGMLGLSKMLKNTELTKQQESYVEKLFRSGTQLLQQLNSVLLDESDQAKPPKVQATSLVDVLATSTALVEGICNDKKVDVNYSLDPALPPVVDTDPNLLQQLVNNLVSNAAKYTSEGSIKIRCDRYSSTNDKLMIRFSVVDTGIGIPYEDQYGVFDAFAKGSNNDQSMKISSGMGLAVVKRICERLGATVTFESTPNEGSAFKVDLPVEVRRQSFKVKKKLTVLVVDDVELNTEIICSLLRDEGHEAVASNDPARALVLAAQKIFDVILVDIHMPVINGEQFFSKLRSQGNFSPVVGISAGLTDELIQHLHAKGMNQLMEKPFSSAVFYSLLDQDVTIDAEADQHGDINLGFLQQLSSNRSHAEIQDLFNRFLSQCTEYLNQLELAIACQDSVIVASTSHSLAGLVSMFGLNDVALLAKALSQVCNVKPIDWAAMTDSQRELKGRMGHGLEQLQVRIEDGKAALDA